MRWKSKTSDWVCARASKTCGGFRSYWTKLRSANGGAAPHSSAATAPRLRPGFFLRPWPLKAQYNTDRRTRFDGAENKAAVSRQRREFGNSMYFGGTPLPLVDGAIEKAAGPI